MMSYAAFDQNIAIIDEDEKLQEESPSTNKKYQPLQKKNTTTTTTIKSKKKGNSPSPKIFPPSLTENKKYEDLRLIQKPFIQHNSQQLKKQNEM